MKKTTLLTVSIFCSTLSAQSFVSSPPGHLSVEGPMHSFDFGAYADGRLMYLDGEMRGSNKSLKELALRRDYWDFKTGASGRYWRNVTLDLSHCDLATPSSTFSIDIVPFIGEYSDVFDSCSSASVRRASLILTEYSAASKLASATSRRVCEVT